MHMQVRKDFVVRQIADEYLLIPVGKMAKKVNGMMCLTESGFLLFQKLQTPCSSDDLVQCLLQEYDVSAQTAENDVIEFLETLKKFSVLEDIQDDEA